MNGDLQSDSAVSQTSYSKTDSTVKVFYRVPSNPLKNSGPHLRIITEKKFMTNKSSFTSTEKFGCSSTRVMKKPQLVKTIVLRSRNQSFNKSSDVSP